MTDTHDEVLLHGVMAEFDTAEKLVTATQKAASAGYTRMDGYSPYPVGEVADALGFPRSEIGAVMFIGGMCGATLGFLLQYYLNGVLYPLNVGGKPFFSWPQFIPIAWEVLVLTACLSGLFGLVALCGFPQPYHPVFNVPQFARASRDRFFLCIESVDPEFELVKVKDFMTTLEPLSIAEVPE